MQTVDLWKSCYAKVPNVIFDCAMRRLSSPQFKIFMAVFRKTYGWSKSHDSIPMKQFVKMTGLTPPTVRSGIQQLVVLGAISQKKKNNL